MNYKRIYDSIIANRKANPLPKTEYGEVHHIIPKSLGGTDEVENLVRLTAREHFICHMLLAEMHEKGTPEWYKMNHAFLMMKAESTSQLRYVNSRYYELKRKDFSEVMSVTQSGSRNSQYGKCWIHNVNTKQCIRIAKNELDIYVQNGWNSGRVVDWDAKVRNDLFSAERKNNYTIKRAKEKESQKNEALKWWNEFTASGCSSISEFVRNSNYPKSKVFLIRQ